MYEKHQGRKKWVSNVETMHRVHIWNPLQCIQPPSKQECIEASLARAWGLVGRDNACGDYPPYPLLIHSNNFLHRVKPDGAGNVSVGVDKFTGLDKDSLSWILWNAFSLWIFELDKLFWNLISIERSVNVWVLEFDFQSVPTSHPRTIKTTIINGAWLRWWPKLWALGGHQSVF